MLFFPLWSLRCNVRMNEFQIFNQAKQLQDYSKKKINLDEKIKEKQGRGTRLST